MDEKMMDDLDPDFLNDILGSSELSENLIDDLLNEIKSNDIMTSNQPNLSSPGLLPPMNPGNLNFVQNVYEPMMINPVYIDSSVGISAADSMIVYPNSEYSGGLPPRRAKKNLKDILSGGETTNTNTILINQNSNFMMNYPLASGQPMNESPVYQLSPSNIQILIENPAVVNPMMIQSTAPPVVASSPVRKVPSSSSIESSPSPIKVKTSKKTGKSSRPLVKIEPEQLKMIGDENAIVKKVKPHKRTSHNAIERKYRSSINDKINELKTRVAGPNVKLQKSGILRKALEYINNIEDVNRRLNEENSMFRTAFAKISVNINNPSVIESLIREVSLSNPSSPHMSKSPMSPSCFPVTPSPSSGSSASSEAMFSMSNDSSNDSSSALSPPAPKRSYKKKTAASDRSRVILCMVLLSVLVFNPFAWMTDFSQVGLSPINENTDAIHGASRVLNAFEDTVVTPTESSHRWNFSWILNSILVLICLAWVYLGGEARVDLNERLTETLWSRYERANKEWTSRKNYEEAHSQLELGLIELGQTPPLSKFNLITGISWQLIRLGLSRIFTSRYFTKITSWWSSDRNMDQSRRLTALFYYEMHKFAYLNMQHELDFVPKSTIKTPVLVRDESNRGDRPYMTTYSYLTAFYYLLALYNQIERMSDQSVMSEYEVGEFYLSMVVFAKLCLPGFISARLVRFMIKNKLMNKLNQDETEKTESRLRKLFNKSLFVNFVINLDRLVVSNGREGRLSSLIGYKRRLFSSSFFYDSDEKSFGGRRGGNSGVAVEFLAGKFKDYVLVKMTNHIIDQSAAVVDVDDLRNGRQRDKAEMNREMNDVDRTRFDALKSIYTQDLEYIGLESRVEQETHRVLVGFLEMMNQWKLGNIGQSRCDDVAMVNSKNSLFIEAVLCVLRAYGEIGKRADKSMTHMKKAVEFMDAFQSKPNANTSCLVEKFEILIYDWILSAQTHLWTRQKLNELELFNKSLNRFKTLVGNYPQLGYKAKMYETILMFSANRNPINLVEPSSSQFLYSKCNQDAFYSINSILKQFQLFQLLE